MRKYFRLVVCVFLLSGCVVPQQDGKRNIDNIGWIIGVWEVEKSKTLESMRMSNVDIPDNIRIDMETKIWGENSPILVLEIKESVAKTYLKNNEDDQSISKSEPVRISQNSDSEYVLTFTNLLNEKYNTKTLYRDGQCIYQMVTRWGFREYYCRGL